MRRALTTEHGASRRRQDGIGARQRVGCESEAFLRALSISSTAMGGAGQRTRPARQNNPGSASANKRVWRLRKNNNVSQRS
jgi:hypothetical protein